MRKTIQYQTEEERNLVLNENSHLTLIEEHNITEGDFLVFSDNPEEDTKIINYMNVPEKEFKTLQQENKLLKLQSQANSDRADFQEEVITEIILTMYQ